MSFQLPSLTWIASPNYSSRGGQRVRLIVAHDCEGSFNGSVSWFAMTASQVSAHIVLSDDGLRAVQMVAWANKAWHVCAFNPFSEGIEMAGYAAKGFSAPEWQSAANIIAFRLKANGIPCQVASAANNWTGFCRHFDLGQAGGGHEDPTTNSVIWQAFVAMVVDAYAQANVPMAWGSAGDAASPPMPSNFKASGTVRNDLAVGSIEWAQMRLNALGVPIAPLTVDGLDGKMTQAAVLRFQQAHHLFSDGIVGPQTIAALGAT